MVKMVSTHMAMVLMVMMAAVALPQSVIAKAALVPVAGVDYQVDGSMKDTLKTLIGKKVYVHLDSGTTLSGYIKAVGNHLLHLAKLDRKDFFDALIKIDRIIAIDTQFRKYK